LTENLDNPFLGRSKKLNLLLVLQVIVYFINNNSMKSINIDINIVGAIRMYFYLASFNHLSMSWFDQKNSQER